MKRGCKRSTLLTFLAFLTWIGGLTIAVEPSDNPIVIIPGILGSQLWAKLNRTTVKHVFCKKNSDWYNIWLSLEQLAYPVEECASDNMILQYDPSTKQYSNTEGVQIETRNFGNTSSVEFLDPSMKFFETTNYFHDMVQHFVDKGYSRGETIRGAPFDWRFAPVGLAEKKYFDKLKAMIEDMYNTYKHKVTIVTHSMGGPISLHFLTDVVDQKWKDMYIKQYITLSAVWGGSVKSVRALISGDNEGIFIDKPLWGRESSRSYQTTMWLLPPAGDLWGDFAFAYTPKGSYSANNYHEMFNDLGIEEMWERYQGVLDNTRYFPVPNVTTYCYYGMGKDTPLQLEYSKDDFPNKPPNVTTGDGDGTVPEKSLKVCSRWIGKQDYPVYMKSFSPVEHVDLLKNKSLIAAVDKIIYS